MQGKPKEKLILTVLVLTVLVLTVLVNYWSPLPPPPALE